MNTQLETLLQSYPDCNILCEGEAVLVVELPEDRYPSEFYGSIVLVALDGGAQQPHFHEFTQEAYLLESGTISLHIGNEVKPLTIGEWLQVPVGTVHFAEGTGLVRVVSKPAWSAEDHHLVT